MAFELIRSHFPALSASALNPERAVTHDTGDTQRSVLGVATVNVEPFGVISATAAAADAVTVYDRGNVVKVTAIASVGAGADIGVASTNGALGIVAGASGVLKWAVGKSLSAAASGEVFSLYVNPRQVSTLAAL